jgi:beta-lactamase class C
MKKKFYLVVVVIILVLPFLVAQMFIYEEPAGIIKKIRNKKTARVPANPHLEKAIDEYELQLNMMQLLSKSPGAAVAIVKDSSIIYMKGFGVRELGTKDSVDVHTVFRIASVSKCFASFLSGILVEEGKIHWDDPVNKYVPEFHLKSPEETNKLKIRNILSHTTGLPMHAYTNLVEEGLPLTEMLGRLGDVPLSSRVGKVYSYQNVAYSLIGEAIRNSTGKSYEAWMVEKVFGPLEMKDASIDFFSMITSKNAAKPYMPRKGGWRKVSINNTYYNVSPAGGVNASISDMAHWMIALLGHRPDVISRETLDTLYSPAVYAPSKNRNYGRTQRYSHSYYGLGWRILHFPGDTLIYHGGFVNGYRSEVAVSPTDRLAICILANSPGELADNAIPVFLKILRNHRDAIQKWDAHQQGVVSHAPPAFESSAQ